MSVLLEVPRRDRTDGKQIWLAFSKGVVVPSEMPAGKKAKLERLSRSKDLDREFIKEVGLDDHKADIAMFEKASKDAKDDDVKAWFAKKLPTLKNHRAQAEKLSHGAKLTMKH